MLLHTATCLFAVGFAFIFVPPQPLLEQLARTRPACHCGRSRLVSPPFYLSTSHIRTTLISITLLTYIPLPLHPFWPGLSLWQVPPTLPISNTLPHFLPLHPLTITLPYLHFSLRYIVARLVIVAGPAISSYPGTSLTPPSLLFPLQHQPTSLLHLPSKLQARLAIVAGLAFPHYIFFLSPLSTHLIFSYRNLARLIIVVGPAHPNPSHLFLHPMALSDPPHNPRGPGII